MRADFSAFQRYSAEFDSVRIIASEADGTVVIACKCNDANKFVPIDALLGESKLTIEPIEKTNGKTD